MFEFQFMPGFWDFFRTYAPSIPMPSIYWDVRSPEQRVHMICKWLGVVIEYCNATGQQVDDIKQTLDDIESGRLDPMIEDAIAQWFIDNQPEIMKDIADLEDADITINERIDNTIQRIIDNASEHHYHMLGITDDIGVNESIMQGGCWVDSDNMIIAYQHEDKTGVTLKRKNMNTGTVSQAVSHTDIGHAQSMCYNAKDNLIYISKYQNYTDTDPLNGFTVVDATTLQTVTEVNPGFAIAGIAYDETENKIYAFPRSGDNRIVYIIDATAYNPLDVLTLQNTRTRGALDANIHNGQLWALTHGTIWVYKLDGTPVTAYNIDRFVDGILLITEIEHFSFRPGYENDWYELGFFIYPSTMQHSAFDNASGHIYHSNAENYTIHYTGESGITNGIKNVYVGAPTDSWKQDGSSANPFSCVPVAVNSAICRNYNKSYIYINTDDYAHNGTETLLIHGGYSNMVDIRQLSGSSNIAFQGISIQGTFVYINADVEIISTNRFTGWYSNDNDLYIACGNNGKLELAGSPTYTPRTIEGQPNTGAGIYIATGGHLILSRMPQKTSSSSELDLTECRNDGGIIECWNTTNIANEVLNSAVRFGSMRNVTMNAVLGTPATSVHIYAPVGPLAITARLQGPLYKQVISANVNDVFADYDGTHRLRAENHTVGRYWQEFDLTSDINILSYRILAM